eukprot:359913-Chlamydomonas_euryale.AAC.16
MRASIPLGASMGAGRGAAIAGRHLVLSTHMRLRRCAARSRKQEDKRRRGGCDHHPRGVSEKPRRKGVAGCFSPLTSVTPTDEHLHRHTKGPAEMPSTYKSNPPAHLKHEAQARVSAPALETRTWRRRDTVQLSRAVGDAAISSSGGDERPPFVATRTGETDHYFVYKAAHMDGACRDHAGANTMTR